MEKNVIVLDTETTNDIECPLTYDIGWLVTTYEGEPVKAYSYVVADVFLDKELMESAFFKDKVPQYWDDIKNGSRKLATLNTIRKEFARCCKRYSINEVYAHNARFDYLALQNTQRFITKSKYRYWLPYGIEICDTLKMSREVLGANEEYKEFCANNEGYTTKNGAPRYTAEIIYRFISGNNDFVEEHRGLEDVLIEKEIMAYCYKANPNLNPLLWDNEESA